MFAVLKNDANMVSVLIELGANKNTEIPKTKHTPLHMAVLTGKGPMVTLLIDKGAEMNSKDHMGFTPLTYAVTQSKKDIIEMLVAKGADTNVKDNFGRALGDVCANNPEIKQLLTKKS